MSFGSRGGSRGRGYSGVQSRGGYGGFRGGTSLRSFLIFSIFKLMDKIYRTRRLLRIHRYPSAGARDGRFRARRRRRYAIPLYEC